MELAVRAGEEDGTRERGIGREIHKLMMYRDVLRSRQSL